MNLATRFRAMQIWLAAREIGWKSLAEGDQFDDDGIQDLLLAAVQRFQDEPTILEGLLGYARHEIDESMTHEQLLTGHTLGGRKSGGRPIEG